jgi:hypothetical protein
MTPLDIAVEVAGWSGAVLILLGYLLISTGRLSGQSPAYQWINLAGAIGFAINGWWHGAIPSTALNVVWAGIAIFALNRILWRKAPAEATSK